MRFYIDDRKEKEMRVLLKQENNRIHIIGEDHMGYSWTLLSLLPDGTFRRPNNIKDDVGIKIDHNGRIKETKDF